MRKLIVMLTPLTASLTALTVPWNVPWNSRGECYSHFHLSVDLVRQIFKIVFLAVLILCIYGCTSEKRKLRQEIINASSKSKTEQVSVDFSKVTGRTVKKICVQHQYMTKASFVELTKMNAPDFKDSLSDGEFVLWVYFDGRSPLQVDLSRSGVIPQKGGGMCTESPLIYIKQEIISFN